MIGAPNSLNLNCKVHVMKEAPSPSVSEEIADIFRNYNINSIDVVSTLTEAMLAYGYLNIGEQISLTFLSFSWTKIIFKYSLKQGGRLFTA